MDVVKRRIFVLAVALSLCCLIGAVFAQTPVPASVSEVLKGKIKVNDTSPVFSTVPFDAGHVFAAIGDGKVQHYDSLGNLLGVLDSGLGGFTTGMAVSPDSDLYVTNFSLDLVSRFTGAAVPHIHSVAFTTDPASSVESIIFDRVGNIYVGQADGTQDILKYDAAGNFLMRYDVAIEDRGSDWIDLDPDQQTMYYTSEGTTVKRYDVVNDLQLSDFATGLPGTIAYALRLLPDAIGGGMLVADTEVIVRLDSMGNVIQTYDAPGEDNWFALNIDRIDTTLTSFWSADFGTGNFYRFDIETGNILVGPVNTGTGPFTLFGLAVFGEFTAGQNNPPVVQANPPGPFFINQGEFLTFEVKALDIDPGDTVTLDVINLPPGAVMTPSLPATGTDSAVSVFTWIPLEDAYSMQPGVFDVTYTAIDAGGLTDTVVVQINVNAAPVCSVNPPGPFTVFLDQPLSFDVLASDPDANDVITLSVTDLPSGAAMTPSLPLTGAASGISSTLDWTPVAGQEDSTYVIHYMVTDQKDTSFCSASITVLRNNPPVCGIVPPGPFVITELDTLTFDVLASDPDGGSVGNELTLEVLGLLPAGAAMTPALPLMGPGTGFSSTFEWMPALGQAGSYTVEYVVTDTVGASDTCSAQITIKGREFPPVCQVTPPGPFVVFPGDLVTFDVSAFDPNPGDVITLSVTGLPAGAVMNPPLPLTGAGTGINSMFTWTPTLLQLGNFLVTYTVVDTSGFQDTCSVAITVNPPNLPPECQVAPPGPFNVLAGNLLNFTVSATDPNPGDVITLSVSGFPTGAAMNPPLPLTGAGSGISSLFSWTPTNADFGNHTVTYIVVDTLGASDTCTVDIMVDTLVQNPPLCQVNPPGPFTVNEGDPLSFDVSASDPDTFDVITLEVSGLPPGAAMTPPLPLTGPFSGISSTFNWTPATGQAGTYVVTYLVTDSFGLKDTCTVDITVIHVNTPPVCAITPATSFTILEGESVTFDVTGTDIDPGDVVTIDLFPGSSLPAGSAMSPALPVSGPSGVSSTFGWTTLYGQAGVYLIKYVVKDTAGDSSLCSVDITVNPAPPDTVSPGCELTNIDPGPPFTIEVTIRDTESGLSQINVITANNAVLTIPPFTVGTRDSVVVIAEKIDQNQSATVVLEVVDVVGNTTQCDPVYQTISATIPVGFALKQNFPNPFNPSTNIHFDVAAGNGGAVNVSLRIYDVTGREVKALVNEAMQPGKYSVEWDATNNRGNTVAGGIYIYRMVAGDFVATRKMVLLK